MSLATLKKKTGAKYNNSSVGTGFALNGTHRNQGYVGQTSLSRSLISTPMVGTVAKGHGGNNGAYPNKIIKPTISQCLEDSKVIKESTLSSKGMIREKYQWAWRGGVHAPAKSADSNNFNYSSYRTEKAKTDTLSSFDISGCEILPGVVYPSARSVFTNATFFTYPEFSNPAYGIPSLSTRRLYAYDFRRNDLSRSIAFTNLYPRGVGNFVEVGTPVSVTSEGVVLAPTSVNQNDDNISANVQTITFPDRQTLVFKFKVTTFDSESPSGDSRSLFHIVDDLANPQLQNVELFSIMYVRRDGIDQYTYNDGTSDIICDGPHSGEKQGTMVIRYGKTSKDLTGNRFNGYYYHSADQIELNTFYTMIIDFELLNTTGADPQRDAGRIKLVKMFKSDAQEGVSGLQLPYEEPTHQFNFPTAMNIEINAASHDANRYSDQSGQVGPYSSISPVFRKIMDPGKIMIGSQLDYTSTPVGGDGAQRPGDHPNPNHLIEDSGFAVVSHLQLFSGEFTNTDIANWYLKYQIHVPTIVKQVMNLIQQNILVRRVGTDQMWTQNREDYNHIDQSQHIERIKSKCTSEDTVLKTRNSRGTPFVGFR